MPSVLSDAAVAEIRQLFQEFTRRVRNPEGPRGRYTNGPVFFEGFLASTLAAASNEKTGATTADFDIHDADAGSGNLRDTKTITVTVANRSLDLSGTSGTYGIIMELNGEYRPIWFDC